MTDIIRVRRQTPKVPRKKATVRRVLSEEEQGDAEPLSNPKDQCHTLAERRSRIYATRWASPRKPIPVSINHNPSKIAQLAGDSQSRMDRASGANDSVAGSSRHRWSSEPKTVVAEAAVPESSYPTSSKLKRKRLLMDYILLPSLSSIPSYSRHRSLVERELGELETYSGKRARHDQEQGQAPSSTPTAAAPIIRVVSQGSQTQAATLPICVSEAKTRSAPSDPTGPLNEIRNVSEAEWIIAEQDADSGPALEQHSESQLSFQEPSNDTNPDDSWDECLNSILARLEEDTRRRKALQRIYAAAARKKEQSRNHLMP